MTSSFHYSNSVETIFFVFLFLIIQCTRSLLLSYDDECLALYQFKQSVHHQDNASFGSTWKITNNASNNNGKSQSDCCLWDGVECSKGHVIGLDLSERFINGTIGSNSTLFSLVHLQKLNLASNDFGESQIPSEIGRLKKLKWLNLSYSGFSGQIPNEVGELIQLSSLDFSGNPLRLQSPSFENLVQNFTQLEELHLSEVDISSPIPHFLANFSSLSSIQLDNCGLQNEFPMGIFHLPKLKVLDVSRNSKLTGSLLEFRNNTLLEHLNLASTGFFGTVPESIRRLSHLTYMNLGGCSFSGLIPSAISNMTQLLVLRIEQNKFTNHVPSLESLSQLNVLGVSGNSFDNGRLPDYIGKLSMLRELYATKMDISGNIPSFLANLTKLSVLKLERNSLSGHIPSSFFNLTQLSWLEVGENQLQGPISSSFLNLKTIEILRLERNNFSGRVDLDIFLGLHKLKNLFIGRNKISVVTSNNYTDRTLPQLMYLDLNSCNLKEFPSFLRFQHRMQGLVLLDNKIHGLVPTWSWNNSRQTLEVFVLARNFITGFQEHPQFLPLSQLKILGLKSNQLQGRLPVPPQTTEIYDVANNSFTGEIPELLCQLKSLQILDLSYNNMNGTLPSCLGLSNSLIVLNLERNNFHGPMMNTFTNGSLLRRIDLSENQLVGHVPRTLTGCTSLEVLSLGDNLFDDVFPSWLGTLAELQVLILRSNKFHGEIQVHANATLQFPKLRIIDLSNNGFSGQLPHEYIQAWNAMKAIDVGKSSILKVDLSVGRWSSWVRYTMTIINKGVRTDYPQILDIFTAIDLSSNNFEGQIPNSLQDLTGLESLNLSNNHLSGSIPTSFGNLKNLESLDLSQNELSGKIPQQLLQLGFLVILNVSFNHLDGHIPQGKQFNTFEDNSYKGNSGLCGLPLSKKCQASNASMPPPSRNMSLLPSERIDWIVVFLGVASGLIIGIVIGNYVYAKHSDWFNNLPFMGKSKQIWIRPIDSRRNPNK